MHLLGIAVDIMTDCYAKHWLLTAPLGSWSPGPIVVTSLEEHDELIKKGWQVNGPYVTMDTTKINDYIVMRAQALLQVEHEAMEEAKRREIEEAREISYDDGYNYGYGDGYDDGEGAAKLS